MKTPTSTIRLGLVTLLMSALLLTSLATGCHRTADAATDDVPSLTALYLQLAARRAENLDRLAEYWRTGVYPRNRVVEGFANVFRDEDGKLCAVANLMWLDGLRGLVDATAEESNLVVLAQVHEGPLVDWIAGSGFLQEEIAQIQVPYMGMPEMDDPNFGVIEDDRLTDALEQVELELRDNSAAALLEAARRQREQILAAYDAR